MTTARVLQETQAPPPFNRLLFVCLFSGQFLIQGKIEREGRDDPHTPGLLEALCVPRGPHAPAPGRWVQRWTLAVLSPCFEVLGNTLSTAIIYPAFMGTQYYKTRFFFLSSCLFHRDRLFELFFCFVLF